MNAWRWLRPFACLLMLGSVAHAQSARYVDTGDDGDRDRGDEWDPSAAFPGNYAAFPLTAALIILPCLYCEGVPWSADITQHPAEIALWAGYAWQPYVRSTSPFLAGGAEWIFYENREPGAQSHRGQVTPMARFGWNFTGVTTFASAGVVIPDRSTFQPGYHLGVGASSFAVMALAVLVGETIPSNVEFGYDWLPKAPGSKQSQSRYLLELGWGF